MTPDQLHDQLRKELAQNERLADMLREDARNYADLMYRRTKDTTDHAGLLRLTGVASGVEHYISTLTTSRSTDRDKEKPR